MDHCQNANEPERAGDGLIEVPEPQDPGSEPVAESETEGESAPEGETSTAETVQKLDRWADELRQEHLQNALTALDEDVDLDEEQRAAIAECSRALVDDILRSPRWRLRSNSTNMAEATTELFDLDKE